MFADRKKRIFMTPLLLSPLPPVTAVYEVQQNRGGCSSRDRSVDKIKSQRCVQLELVFHGHFFPDIVKSCNPTKYKIFIEE